MRILYSSLFYFLSAPLGVFFFLFFPFFSSSKKGKLVRLFAENQKKKRRKIERALFSPARSPFCFCFLGFGSWGSSENVRLKRGGETTGNIYVLRSTLLLLAFHLRAALSYFCAYTASAVLWVVFFSPLFLFGTTRSAYLVSLPVLPPWCANEERRRKRWKQAKERKRKRCSAATEVEFLFFFFFFLLAFLRPWSQARYRSIHTQKKKKLYSVFVFE